MEIDREALRAHIRTQIRPFPSEQHYPTGWNGNMTFAELRTTLTPSINRLMRYYRYVEVDIPDMIQHGFMRLWEELSKQSDLLSTLDQGGAVKWVMYRSGISHYRKFYRREMYLEDLATRSGDPDEFIIDGYEGGFYRDHARYAEAVDLRTDIEQVMTFMGEKYQHSRAHLAALYYITTSVALDDAAALAERSGTKKAWWLTSVVKPMREELCELLGLERPGRTTWQEKVRAGDDTPLLHLVDHFQKAGDDRMAVALRGLAKNESTQAMMDQLDLPKTHVHYLRRKAHQELNRAYGCIA
ncbi:MAG: hypothetical protein CL610_19030 [Anaerolineaceae bacterium]|nr:hypothetical protein [Anaerolineaceae bacterium]